MDSSHPGKESTLRPDSRMLVLKGNQRSFKTKIISIVLTLVTFFLMGETGSHNLHEPTPSRWTLIRTTDGQTVAINETYLSPTFTFDLCSLFETAIYRWSGWNSDPPIGCQRLEPEQNLKNKQHYICPSSSDPTCGELTDYYCASWGCVTIGPTLFIPAHEKDKYLGFQRQPYSTPGLCSIGNCNPTIITVKNSQDPSWITGRTWGLRLYVNGYDPGTAFTIQRTPLPAPHQPIGPNLILNPRSDNSLTSKVPPRRGENLQT